VIEHVDRIADWGRRRQAAWSEHYQYVLRYLRDVVRLDPERALSHRLREQVTGWVARPFHLQIARAPSIRLLRPLEPRVERPVVARPRADREAAPSWVEPEDVLAELERLVREAVAGGAATLGEVTARVMAVLPEHACFVAAGRVAEILARIGPVRGERERPWTCVRERLEVEDWIVQREDGA
ncbi:MAG TPA: hypothetical protein VK932_09285, partial [Kofleriaceae bacterium]|nr:hypothetical protein [Kofleriaceae bacterium]